MTTQCEDPSAQFPIHEFDRIGSELARKSTWYAKMTIELDRITAPNYHPTPTPTPLTPARSGFIYKGIFEPCRSDIDIRLGACADCGPNFLTGASPWLPSFKA